MSVAAPPLVSIHLRRVRVCMCVFVSLLFMLIIISAYVHHTQLADGT